MSEQLSCPACGNDVLTEFFEPSGVVFCPECGNLLRRNPEGLAPLGIQSTELASLFRERRRATDRSDRAIKNRVIDIIAERHGIDRKTARRRLENSELDSLEVVEVVMAIEEEFGIAAGH